MGEKVDLALANPDDVQSANALFNFVGRLDYLVESLEKKALVPRYCEEDTDTSIEHVKELEAELHELRIENAFLKELRRLRLEDEAKMRERRESSTVSEENSN